MKRNNFRTFRKHFYSVHRFESKWFLYFSHAQYLNLSCPSDVWNIHKCISSQKCTGSDFNKEKGVWILRYWEFSVLTKYFSNSSRPMREMYCPLLDGVSKVGQEPSGERLLQGSFNWGDTGLPFKCSPRKAKVKTWDMPTEKICISTLYPVSGFSVFSFDKEKNVRNCKMQVWGEDMS